MLLSPSEATDSMIVELDNLQPGERVIYYAGQLAYDREGMDPISVRLHRVANAAYNGAKMGRLCLVQKRIFADPEKKGLDKYEYIAVGRVPPKVRPSKKPTSSKRRKVQEHA